MINVGLSLLGSRQGYWESDDHLWPHTFVACSDKTSNTHHTPPKSVVTMHRSREPHTSSVCTPHSPTFFAIRQRTVRVSETNQTGDKRTWRHDITEKEVGTRKTHASPMAQHAHVCHAPAILMQRFTPPLAHFSSAHIPPTKCLSKIRP